MCCQWHLLGRLGSVGKSYLGPNLEKNSIRFLDPALFHENYTDVYFDVKHLTMILQGLVKFEVPFFKRKGSFWTVSVVVLIYRLGFVMKLALSICCSVTL